jgi:hypothetical protein
LVDVSGHGRIRRFRARRDPTARFTVAQGNGTVERIKEGMKGPAEKLARRDKRSLTPIVCARLFSETAKRSRHEAFLSTTHH